MYWFLAGFLAGLVINFLSRKLIEGDFINLLWEALRPAKWRFTKPHRSVEPPIQPHDSPSKQIRAVGM